MALSTKQGLLLKKEDGRAQGPAWFIRELAKAARWLARFLIRKIIPSTHNSASGSAKSAARDSGLSVSLQIPESQLIPQAEIPDGNGNSPVNSNTKRDVATDPAAAAELDDKGNGRLSFPLGQTAVDAKGEKAAGKSIPTPIFPLRWKIILPFLALATLIGVAGAYIVSQVVIDTVEERFMNQMVEAGILSSEWIVREEEHLLNTLRLLSNAQGMVDAILASDSESLREIVLPIALNYSLETVHVLDGDGIAILSLTQKEGGILSGYSSSRGADSFQSNPLVRNVLDGRVDAQGDKYAGIVVLGDVARFLISGPVKDADGEPLGAVLVGLPLESMVNGIRETTLAQITVYGLEGETISTTFLDEVAALDSSVADRLLKDMQGQSFTRTIAIAGIDYGEIVAPFAVRGETVLGLIGTAIPETTLVRVSYTTRLQITGFVAAGILLAIAAGMILASRLTRPLGHLVDAASEISSGNLKVNVTERGNDELASLAWVFNRMASSLDQSTTDLIQANQSTLDAYERTIEGWAKALEIRDWHTEGHTRRVTDLTLRLARVMEIPESEMPHLRRGVMLHDIGKMGIPDNILRKPGPLDDDEWSIMQQHPVYAMEMLSNIEYLRPALGVPYSHHEKWDGSGYPQGLRGDEIPLAARIFSVVDVWDAVTSDRPYRDAMSEEEALQIIREGAGSHFDPAVAFEFITLICGERGMDLPDVEPSAAPRARLRRILASQQEMLRT